MNIAILGFGREGKSALHFLKKSPEFRRDRFYVLDRKGNSHYLKNLTSFDLIIRSPGIPWNLPELKAARRAGVKFSSATKLFFEVLKQYKSVKVIGVTGTKGKGTTSTLIYQILKSSGKNVFLAGNIGKSPLELLPKLKKSSWVILELSSFQLQDLTQSPNIAVVLDIFPDHQDSHLNLKEYYEAKTNIGRHQKRNDSIFYFKNHSLSHWVASKSRGRKIPVDELRFNLFTPADLKVRGMHNFKNATMAATVAKALGISDNVILRSVKKFRGLKHRLEFVREIKLKKSEIYFYNDSASTNPQTTRAALLAFPEIPKILIAGGQDKNLNYATLKPILHSKIGQAPTKLVVLLGENRKKIYQTIKQPGLKIVFASNLKQAVQKCWAEARTYANTHANTIIIFSPGAASFDMFRDYVDRGEKFKRIVKLLKTS